MKSCYIYIRVSTDEQATEGYSLDHQKRACRDYAVNKGYHPKKIFVDEGKSGRTANRPEFQKMLEKIKNNEVNCVVIYKIDRFARNVTDFSRIRKEFIRAKIDFHSVTEGDLSSGSNSLIANIFASVAEWESEVNGKRTRDALEQKFRAGWQPTPPPHGYRSVGGERERKTCEPDPYTAPIIKELFELYATGGYSILEIQDWLSEKDIISKNGTPLGHSVINNILRNPFYYGLIRWKGKSKTGKHKSIISKALFDTCQYILAKHRSFLIRKRKHNFLLRSFIYCDECGQRYTAEWHDLPKSKKLDKIAYYHCPKHNRNGCPAPYIEISKLETQVEKIMKTMQFNQQFIQAVIKKTKQIINNNRQHLNSQRIGLVNKKTSLESKRNKLEDSLLDDTIDEDAYKRMHARIQSKIHTINEHIQNLEDKNNIDVNLIEEVLSFTRNVHKTYKLAPKFLKRHYLRFFFEKIYIKNKKISRMTPTPIFAILKENHEVIIRTNQLERWKVFRQIDWATYLEYPEFVFKETQKFLAFSVHSKYN